MSQKLTFAKRGTISEVISGAKKAQVKKKQQVTMANSGGSGGGGVNTAAAAPASVVVTDKKFMALPKQFHTNPELKDTLKLEMLPHEKGAAFPARFYIYKNKLKVRCKDAEAYYRDAHYYVQRAMARAQRIHFLYQATSPRSWCWRRSARSRQ